jgi:hypothetical protein
VDEEIEDIIRRKGYEAASKSQGKAKLIIPKNS